MPGGHAIGDIFTTLAAILYAVYSTFLKVQVPEEKEDDFKYTWFLGFAGLFNAVLILPLFPLFHVVGLEPFSWPN